MTIAEGPQQVNPEFLQIFRSHAKDFDFEPSAQRLVMNLLARGTEAFPEAVEGEPNEALEEAKAGLDNAMSSVADELRRQGISRVDESSLSLLMQAQCPLPPFCYGPESSSAMASTGDTAKESAKRPAPA
jgi:hypothetical protein